MKTVKALLIKIMKKSLKKLKRMLVPYSNNFSTLNDSKDWNCSTETQKEKF